MDEFLDRVIVAAICFGVAVGFFAIGVGIMAVIGGLVR